ncbi:hypothetical protein FQR65_LT00346 [Abscondita terminalis]|nr:hypothetical protein FQR65_LT00346 [Abscondita terminalis]
MALLFFSWIDYTVFSILTALGCIIGVYFGFHYKQDSVENYLNGGKNLKWFPVSMSLVSSAFTGFSLMGYPTEVYMHGTQISVLILSIFICGWLNYYVFLPVFFKLQLRNVYEYLELRYNKLLKNIFSLIYIVNTLFLLPMLMYVPSLIFSQGVSLHVIAPIMILICIFYTVVGGIKAVIWADTLQFAVTILTLAIVITLGVILVGGFDVIFDRVQAGERWEFFNFSLDPTVRTTFWTGVVGHTFSWTSMIIISAPEVQRFLALSSMKIVKKALIIFIFVTVAAKAICFLLGVIIYAKYYDCDPKSIGEIKKLDQIVPYFITEVTQGIYGLNGLFVAAFFGAAFRYIYFFLLFFTVIVYYSTFSTALNTVASVLYTHFAYLFISNKRLQTSQRFVIKLITFAIGVSSIGIIYLVENGGTIFELVYYIHGIISGPNLGIFLLGLVVPFANVKGAFAGTLASMILMGVIIINTQIYIRNGVLKYGLKPLHTFGCNLTNYSIFLANTSSSTPQPRMDDQEEPIWLFKISFQYYCLIGTVTTVLVGVIVSLLTRENTGEQVNPDYISPFVHKLGNVFTKRRIKLSAEDELLKSSRECNGTS